MSLVFLIMNICFTNSISTPCCSHAFPSTYNYILFNTKYYFNKCNLMKIISPNRYPQPHTEPTIQLKRLVMKTVMTNFVNVSTTATTPWSLPDRCQEIEAIHSNMHPNFTNSQIWTLGRGGILGYMKYQRYCRYFSSLGKSSFPIVYFWQPCPGNFTYSVKKILSTLTSRYHVRFRG